MFVVEVGVEGLRGIRLSEGLGRGSVRVFFRFLLFREVSLFGE